MANIYILAGSHEHPEECEPDIITDVFKSRREAAKEALEMFRKTFPDSADEFTIADCMESNLNPTVYDFLDMFADPDMQEVAIFDLTKGEEIYRGTRDEMPGELQELEIMSIDTLHEATKVLTLNVEA